MTNFKSSLYVRLAVFAALLTFAFSAFAKTDPAFSNIKIRNFGQMDERFYRGAQPKDEDFKALAGLGIKTVIDLRDDPESSEKGSVEGLGMRYVNIPMSDKDTPTAQQVNQFLKLVADPATGKFFVHCAGGRHRTGVMGAMYRFNHDHWNYDQAYAEMKQYDFYTRFGHGKLKDFVQNYWQQMQAGQAATPAVVSVAGQK
jgi:protein tyrosine/serine phosphatase